MNMLALKNRNIGLIARRTMAGQTLVRTLKLTFKWYFLMHIRLIKLFDAVIGRLAAMLLPEVPVAVQPVTIRRILLIRPGGIGDAVHLIPTINAINSAFPEAVIDVLAEKRNSAIFGLCPLVHSVFHYERPTELLRAMRNSYDVVIDTEQWHRLSAVVARMTCSSLLIGFGTNERSRLFNHPIRYSHDNYEVINFLNLLEPLGFRTGFASERFLLIPDVSAATASRLLADVGSEPFVVIFPGASIDERQWGSDRFHHLAEQLSVFGIKIVVVGGKEDRQQGEKIVAGGLGLNLAGRTSLSETAAVIDKSTLLVSGDSGVLHIAVGLGKPTVSLFGPGRTKKWAPRGNNHIVINKELSCSPCTTYGNTPACTINARCMKDINVDEVSNAVTMLLTSEGIMPSRCCNSNFKSKRPLR